MDQKQPRTGIFMSYVQNSKLVKNRHFNLKVGFEYLESLVKSQLSYGVQNWNITEKLKNRLNAAWENFLRKTTNQGYKRKLNDANPFKLLCFNCNIQTVQQEKFLAHVIRSSDEGITKRLLFNKKKYTNRDKRT